MNFIGILQVVVALGLLNVWLLRYSKKTEYRGGTASNLKEEFAVYGFPEWFYYLIGALKVGSAIALIYGLTNPSVPFGAAGLVTLLMIGALAMHIKVKDPLKRSVPAFVMLAMSATILVSGLMSGALSSSV